MASSNRPSCPSAAEAALSASVTGFDSQRLPVATNRLVEPPLAKVSVAQVVLGLGIIGFDLQGLQIILHDRLVQQALLGQDDCEVMSKFGVLGADFNGLAIAGRRLLASPAGPHCRSEIRVSQGEFGPEVNCLLKMRSGFMPIRPALTKARPRLLWADAKPGSISNAFMNSAMAGHSRFCLASA